MTRSFKRLALVLVVFAAFAYGWLSRVGPPDDGTSTLPPATTMGAAEAFEQRRSDVWVDDKGTVSKLLPDDRDGSRHQKFILRLDGGLTVLVVHNIDLAPRVPVVVGHELEVRGEYVWNDKGGLIHWTHDDPDHRRRGGWIRYEDRVYH